jgi:hypothetical protein
VAGNGLAPVISPRADPSAPIVSVRVVHTVGASHCKKGLPLTGLGIGAPVRPPVV